MKRHKFNARKVINAFGKFDSNTEFERYLYLRRLEQVHEISNLTRQPEFEIIPKLTYTKHIQLKTKVKDVERVDEYAAHYTPDFQYIKNNKIVIEEVKSEATAKENDYILRRKLLKHKIVQWNKEAGFEKYVFNEIIFK